MDSNLGTISWVQVAPSLAFGLGMPRSIVIELVALIVTGFGNGFSRTTLFTLISSTVEHEDIGVADITARSAFGFSFGAGAFVAFLTLPACRRLRITREVRPHAP